MAALIIYVQSKCTAYYYSVSKFHDMGEIQLSARKYMCICVCIDMTRVLEGLSDWSTQ